ncbi:MAG: LPXTG cell wall anchor domain-containing protein [Aquihabitans sp.]
MVRKVLLGAVMIVALFAAPAAAQYGTFTVNPGSVRPGGQASFNGKGCKAGETVTVTVQGTVVATVTAKPNGSFNGNFTVNLPSGNYTVVSTCGSLVQSAPLLVRSANASNSPGGTGGTGGTTLPRTGSNIDTLGLMGAALLVAGGGVMLATRKRRVA